MVCVVCTWGTSALQAMMSSHAETETRGWASAGGPTLAILQRSVFFFFQAEDGIRDVAVTGVQTCALPICTGAVVEALAQPGERLHHGARAAGVGHAGDAARPAVAHPLLRGAAELVGRGRVLQLADAVDPRGEPGLWIPSREVHELEMGVTVDETGDQRGIGELERPRAGRRGDAGVRADGRDLARVVNENGAVRDRRRRDGMHRARADAQRHAAGG